MEYFFSLLVSVAAEVIGYYIRKWLDGDDRQHSLNGTAHRDEQESPGGKRPPGDSF